MRVTDRRQAQASRQSIGQSGVPPLSNGEHLFLRFGDTGDHVTLALPDSIRPGLHTVLLSVVTSWDYAIVQWSLDGKDLGPPFNGYSPETWRRISIAPRVLIEDRPHELKATVVARDPRSTGFAAGLDAVLLRPTEDRE